MFLRTNYLAIRARHAVGKGIILGLGFNRCYVQLLFPADDTIS